MILIQMFPSSLILLDVVEAPVSHRLEEVGFKRRAYKQGKPCLVEMNKKLLDNLFGSFEIPSIFQGKDREWPVIVSEQFSEGAFTTRPDSLYNMGFAVLQESLFQWNPESYEIVGFISINQV